MASNFKFCLWNPLYNHLQKFRSRKHSLRRRDCLVFHSFFLMKFEVFWYMNLCRTVKLSPFHMFRNTHTKDLVTFQNSLQYVRNIYDSSTDNAADLSSWSNLKKEICEKNSCFCTFISFCSSFISIFAKITSVRSSINQLSVVLKFLYTYNYANPVCSICQSRALHGVEIISRNANYSRATG